MSRTPVFSTKEIRMCRMATILASVTLIATINVVAARADVPSSEPGCHFADVPTTALLVPATMHGILCEPSAGASTVMVLVPGATYNHTYWDFPHDPATYNFREAMNVAGYATFTVDRLSTGSSSRPLSALLTSAVQAHAVHDVIAALHAGKITRWPFAKVILGGHSGGSAIAIIEAATYHDEDGVLITGWSHDLDLVNLATVFATLYPATLDPAFAGKNYDPAYVTTRPGSRRADFYGPTTTDPAVVAVDEQTKDVESATEVADAFAVSAETAYSKLITSPVLLVDGQNDILVCGPLSGECNSAAALGTQEAPFYAGSSCFQTYVLAGAGHSINLATDAPDYQHVVVDWANKFVGHDIGSTAQPECAPSARR